MAKAALIRQNSVIGDLMDISKISKGSLKPQIRKVDLKLVITSSVKEMEPLALKKKIKIKTSLEEGLPEVAADFKELRHVLINLLSNAIKFNKEGGKVLIEAERKGEFVEVCIADTGIGIPQKYLPKIFDRFYQIDSGVTRKYGGTGLGLAIVKEIIELYGGQVKVESEVGKGSKFTFTVPMWKKGNSTICK
jgi:signal transduction histidine kinase